MLRRQCLCGLYHLRQIQRGQRAVGGVGEAVQCPVLAGHGQPQWTQKMVNISLRPPGHDGQRTAHARVQGSECGDQAGGHPNRIGARGQFGEGAVEIQKKRVGCR